MPPYVTHDHLCKYRFEEDRLQAEVQELQNLLENMRVELTTYKLQCAVNVARRRLRKKRKLCERNHDTKGIPLSPAAPLDPVLPLTQDEEIQLRDLFCNMTGASSVIALQQSPLYERFRAASSKFKLVTDLIPALCDLEKLVGMDKAKQAVFDLALSRIQTERTDIQHISVTGPPGIGKTSLIGILAKIMHATGVVKLDKVVHGGRHNMVGKYLGHSASQTRKLIEAADGGVLVVDEVYSLGHVDGKDSFGKEAVDTLTAALTDDALSFVCIVAGYEKEVEECFFQQNPGLRRRFTINFHIDRYTPNELYRILLKKAESANVEIPDSEKPRVQQLIQDNSKRLVYFGGDIEAVLKKAVVAAGVRCARTHLVCDPSVVLTTDDLEKAVETLLSDRKDPEEDRIPHFYT